MSNPKRLPKERIMWKAHQECVLRYKSDPSPVNKVIAEIIAQQWKDLAIEEMLNE